MCPLFLYDDAAEGNAPAPASAQETHSVARSTEAAEAAEEGVAAAVLIFFCFHMPLTNFSSSSVTRRRQHGGGTPSSDIPEGCVLVGPQNSRFLYLATAY